jgi:hypothetical protein
MTPGTWGFCGDASTEEWCERRLLSRIHHYTLKRLRAEIEPVAARDFLRFLFDWQHVSADARMAGPKALDGVAAQLEGFEAPAAAWESEIAGQPLIVRETMAVRVFELASRGERNPVILCHAALGSLGSRLWAASVGSLKTRRRTPKIKSPSQAEVPTGAERSFAVDRF